eukprot:CAMPEP_0182444298 /NCGR_PEP_ID=MMETSP1172-20130603/2797_1 /TAXON_ID=708627 /ORGANISM="Timspurckia oligopyrenoides, Strain CCMP3278" /LENGTH=209 /DNA_ID=CAMNT_0024639825 /DNA_START=54 /DNA_END=683 /DNA_ORIENTATION=+
MMMFIGVNGSVSPGLNLGSVSKSPLISARNAVGLTAQPRRVVHSLKMVKVDEEFQSPQLPPLLSGILLIPLPFLVGIALAPLLLMIRQHQIQMDSSVPGQLILASAALGVTFMCCSSLVNAAMDVYKTARKMHSIPCSKCKYYCASETNQRIKCSLWMDKGATYEAIGCIDFKDKVTGFVADPTADETRDLRILQHSLKHTFELPQQPK